MYTTYGRQAAAQGQYAKALKFFMYALEEAQKADGLVGRTLEDLADLYRIQGDYAKAEPVYQRSLAMSERTGCPDSNTVAIILQKYALLLKATNRQAEAEEFEKRAAAILDANT